MCSKSTIYPRTIVVIFDSTQMESYDLIGSERPDIGPPFTRTA